MKIMVFDVPAETGGALSILNEFYNKYKNDNKNEYIFVLSKVKLEESENIKVLNYPWIKKSWFHRIYFDNFIAPKIIRENKIDEVFSLQNVIIPNTKVKQTVYIHNAIPFSEYKFKFKENKLLWVYQNLIGRDIFNSIKKANKVIVQTKWMKNKCIEKIGVIPNKIEVLPPKIEINVKNYFEETKESLSTFFYPASGVEFKNHKVIIEACLELKNRNINNYKIILTLNGNENDNIRALYKCSKDNNLPIEFIGYINKDKIFDYYSKSVLIFPSYIETIGLPLMEAMKVNSPILCSDCDFAHEVLYKYSIKYFFNPLDVRYISELIELFINKSNEII